MAARATHAFGIFGTRLAALFVLLLLAPPANAGPPSYRDEVVPLITRAGCSMGACHGNATGKGGFKLSLRTEDPANDHAVLTEEWLGRRINRVDPDQSLLLLKATAQIPHEGGQRFRVDSDEYRLLRDWIAEGARDDAETAPSLVALEVAPLDKVVEAPESSARLTVTAVWSDGRRQDAARRVVYESSNVLIPVSPDGLVERKGFGETVILVRFLQTQTPVRIAFIPRRDGFVYQAPRAENYIDDLVDQKLRRLKLLPSPLCSDTEFIRRAFLDLTGSLPTADEARRFVSDPSPSKRRHWTDQLLTSPAFADHWALKWADTLRAEERSLDFLGVTAFQRWIRDRVASNKPLDQFAREILSAAGSTYTHPEASFYRAVRDPLSRGEAVARVFLGTRLQCAKCHNHPFERWTQADYYDWSSVFARVRYTVLENQRKDELDQNEFVGEQIVWHSDEGSVTNAKTGLAAKPRFLGAKEGGSWEDPLTALADWMTAPGNALFARAQANRIWAQLMGKGIVDPVDDFRATNPGSNPPLLDALARDLVESGFDQRRLIRAIVASRTYQLSTVPNSTNQDDDSNFSRALARRLSAEQILDSASQVTGIAPEFHDQPSGVRAARITGGRPNPRYGETPADRFLAVFGKPERQLACDCERSAETTMSQAFQLVSGPVLQDLISRPQNHLADWLAGHRAPELILDDLYWSALSRPATQEERERFAPQLANSANARAYLEDLAWAVLNAKEFLFRK
ncbi:MAG: DUF1553 domain-containing protein [Verrucomicrobia bacterium]|nr:DUF1553 domain-containing protein [Verrucomicrobiota bacterium]MBI3867217.1 DUF1553 domain-containing protein [Verrucomicrobiota bacterium]